MTKVARRLGFGPAFTYRSAADVFREHAALSAFENHGRRDFDIGALAAVSDQAFDALDPVQWPLRQGEKRHDRRFFADGGFYTPDRVARAEAGLAVPARLCCSLGLRFDAKRAGPA